MEVDGYTHHWSPEAKAGDEARRNRLRLDGIFLLVYTWIDVRFEQFRMRTEISTALARFAPGPHPAGPHAPPPARTPASPAPLPSPAATLGA